MVTRFGDTIDFFNLFLQDDMNKINKRIDADIKAEKKRLRNMIKILLLGCGEAGKVTLVLWLY